MTILVIAELCLKSAPASTSASALLDAVQVLAADTRTEAGCISYSPLVDPELPGRVVIVEKWRDEASLKAHGATPHMARFKASITGVSVNIEKYRI